jgi:hypothetical protein
VSLGTTQYTCYQSWHPMEIQQIFKCAGGSVSLGTICIINPGTPTWKFQRFLRVLEEVCL